MASKRFPECWGHRGASAAYPENTLASFEAAIRDGADGIESDVHVSTDDVVIMFHDPSLDRTTNGKGLIREHSWYGPDGMQHLRTTKQPVQSIPTFVETVALLMKPENSHVKFNVDVKVWNDPARLFTLMHTVISAHENWETDLAPRILLGLWHPRFVGHAKTLLPYCKRSFIGVDLLMARQYFWNDVDVFSIHFTTLATADGESFRRECKEEGKQVMAWTVNDPKWMIEMVLWDIDGILTDVPVTWYALRKRLETNLDQVVSERGWTFQYATWLTWYPVQALLTYVVRKRLIGVGGPLEGSLAEGERPPTSSTCDNVGDALK
ncbi:PLC-like phosphodiesterase [Panus rudis PR-1116 ss-1]|nr:PLC-like phosphodiesterase [Panus rudis PR-1116 ss-1]